MEFQEQRRLAAIGAKIVAGYAMHATFEAIRKTMENPGDYENALEYVIIRVRETEFLAKSIKIKNKKNAAAVCDMMEESCIFHALCLALNIARGGTDPLNLADIKGLVEKINDARSWRYKYMSDKELSKIVNQNKEKK